jgi:hypothetical protein
MTAEWPILEGYPQPGKLLCSYRYGAKQHWSHWSGVEPFSGSIVWIEVLGLEAVVSSDGPVGVLCEPPVPYLATVVRVHYWTEGSVRY